MKGTETVCQTILNHVRKIEEIAILRSNSPLEVMQLLKNK